MISEVSAVKKTLAVISAMVLLLSLCACKRTGTESENTDTKEDKGFFSGIFSSDKKEAETTTTTIPAEEASHLAKKIENGRFGSFDDYGEEDKQKIKEYAEKDGYTLEYNEDGSGTLSNEEGTWFVGKGWVDNEYTDGVPPIDFGKITMSSECEENEKKYYIFLVKETSADRAKEYADSVKAAGFEEIGESVTDLDAGIVTFTGENESGKHIEIAYSGNGLTVKILMNK